VPTDSQGNYYSRPINLNDPEELSERLTSASRGAMTGAKFGSVVPLGGTAVGATLGAIGGFILGDQETVFPIDMIAIPAYQAYLLNGTPAFTIYIKEGEVLTQVQPTDAMQANATVSGMDTSVIDRSPKKKRKLTKWNRYCKKPSNQIKYKSGAKKGLLNLKSMSAAYHKANGTKKPRRKKGGKN